MFSTKLTIVTTTLAVAVGLTASLLHIEFMTYFINTSLTYNMVRVASLVLLGILLFTNPPRSLFTRSFLGLSGIALHVWAVNLLLNSSLGLIDGLVFMAVAIVLEIEALEPQTAPQHSSLARLTT